MTLYRFVGEMLNGVLHIAHLLIIAFIVSGWLFQATRLFHLLLLFSTLIYWYVLGPWVQKMGGFGHCLITDIQWELKKRLGHTMPHGGYIQYLVDLITKRRTDEKVVDRMTNTILFLCLLASAILLILP